MSDITMTQPIITISMARIEGFKSNFKPPKRIPLFVIQALSLGGGEIAANYFKGDNGDIGELPSGIALGAGSKADAVASVAVGEMAQATGIASTASGYAATATGLESTAVGVYSNATGMGATASGAYASATNIKSTALGHGAVSSHVNSFAAGAGSITTRENEFSVGAVGDERIGANFLPGVLGTDLVNLDQSIAIAEDCIADAIIAQNKIAQNGATNGQSLVWNGSQFAPQTVTTAPGGSSGQLQYNLGGVFTGLPGVSHANSTTTVLAQAANAKPFVIQAFIGQTENLTEWRDSVGAMMSRMSSVGDLEVASTLFFDDANGFITRSSVSNVMQFAPSSGISQMSLQNGKMIIGPNATIDMTLEFQRAATGGVVNVPVIRPADRGGSSGVGHSMKLKGGNGSTNTTGAAGGSAFIEGGAAGGSGNNIGGSVKLTPGAGTGSGGYGHVILENLRTSSAGLPAGVVWNNNGALYIS